MPAARPTEALIARALRAWRAAGLEVGAIEVAPDGTVRILASPPASAQPPAGGNSCDGRFGVRQ